jgi:hypothetical protein
LTVQPDSQPLTIFLVIGFLFVARFLLGFGGVILIFINLRRSVAINTILASIPFLPFMSP